MEGKKKAGFGLGWRVGLGEMFWGKACARRSVGGDTTRTGTGWLAGLADLCFITFLGTWLLA